MATKDLLTWTGVSEKKAAYKAAKALTHNDHLDFWQHEARLLTWHKEFHTVHQGSISDSQWFLGGEINASVNCLDRHINNGLKEKTAIVFESEQGQVSRLSFQELYHLTVNIAAVLYKNGIRSQDRVAIYMPMGPEAVASLLACARIGAIHTVIFGGFSNEAVAERILDAKAKAIITSTEGQRRGTALALNEIVDKALADKRCSSVSTVLCFGHNKAHADPRYVPYEESSSPPDPVINPIGFEAEHPLFILYTSGTTGKPKGIFHSTGGYLTQVISTTRWAFDIKDEDLFWCTADVGWITGHSYIVYGPLALGKSIFIYEGALNWPDPSRIYQLIDAHEINILYTAPTAIRMFMREGEALKKKHSLSSLRLLGSVGEPINPEAWHFYHRVFGDNKCDIIDSWWQTETGAMMITPLEHLTRQKPGSASTPFLGISAKIVDDDAREVLADTPGYLVMDKPWPSMARGIWGDEERFQKTYFEKFPGYYFTGDQAHRDSDGDFSISGRIDDVVNVSGHRLGTAEVESALVSHPAVAEAAVVGALDEVTGQRLVAFVLLMSGIDESPSLSSDLKAHVAGIIGSFAKPSEIHFERVLPKTRSGKIMRRLLRAKARGQKETSDLSTLDDSSVE